MEAIKRPLSIEEIDFRIQSINNGKYATILAYKDARVDMNRLDEAFGIFGWKREHTRDNKNCIISIWDAENKHWVSKEDTGTESNTEQAKGLASDSFKRAGFNVGIGRELYDYPIISIRLNDDEVTKVGDKYRQSYNLKLKDWTWESRFEGSKIAFLKAVDEKGRERYVWSIDNKAKLTQLDPASLFPELKRLFQEKADKISVDHFPAIEKTVNEKITANYSKVLNHLKAL
jgi:hypothetical protein